MGGKVNSGRARNLTTGYKGGAGQSHLWSIRTFEFVISKRNISGAKAGWDHSDSSQSSVTEQSLHQGCRYPTCDRSDGGGVRQCKLLRYVRSVCSVRPAEVGRQLPGPHNILYPSRHLQVNGHTHGMDKFLPDYAWRHNAHPSGQNTRPYHSLCQRHSHQRAEVLKLLST